MPYDESEVQLSPDREAELIKKLDAEFGPPAVRTDDAEPEPQALAPTATTPPLATKPIEETKPETKSQTLPIRSPKPYLPLVVILLGLTILGAGIYLAAN